MAFAGRTESVEIPKPREDFWAGKESFAAVAAKSLPAQKHSGGLPTPPNSLSPSLPPHAPHAYKGHGSSRPLTPPAHNHIDSDIDLEDAVEHAKAQDSPQRHLTKRDLSNVSDPDAVGNITPSLLAKHHLPGILLEHGPLAIRHVMSYLTTSVPGFSSIPPAKARRLVVGALEGRGGDGLQDVVENEVVFEKVGWGRWDARKRGQPGRQARETYEPMSTYSAGSVRIPVSSTRLDLSRGLATSHESDPDYDTPMEDLGTPEHEVDRMSFDDSHSSYGPPQRKRAPEDDLSDVTDEEDWASIGASALRQGSFPLSGGLLPRDYRDTSHRGMTRSRGPDGRPPAKMARSMPSTRSPLYNSIAQQQEQAAHALMGFAPIPATGLGGFGGDDQDRAAVEALLKLSSV